jgi:exonuclease SbcC
MIPLNIQIKNFLSYGSDLQTVDFSSYQLICLSGKNGHGKSALLDAITWALWGQARKVGGSIKADQGLVKIGQTQMLVILDFMCNDTHYRVRREFAITYGKPYAALDFAMVSEDGQEIESYTEKTIRDTQKKIDDTLRLDYEAFINSAFLRQGQANEFSKKSPKERKEILANILGLQRFEELRQAAHEQVRQATAHQAQLMALQEKLTLQLKDEEAAKGAHAALTAQLDQEQQQWLVLQKEELSLQEAVIAHQKKELELHHVRIKLDNLTTQQTEQRQRLRTLVSQWRSTHRMLIALPEHTKIIQQKQEIEAQIALHTHKLEQRLTFKEQLINLQQELLTYQQLQEKNAQTAHEQQRVAVHQAELASKHAEQTLKLCIEKQAQRTDEIRKRQEQRAQLMQIMAAAAQHAQDFKQEDKLFEKRKAFYQQWLTQITWLKKELDATQQKIELCHDDVSTSCPLCEQNVSSSRKKFIKQKLVQTESAQNHRLQRLAQAVPKLKAILIEQHKQLTLLKKELEAHTVAEHALAQLDKDEQAYNAETLRIQEELQAQQERTTTAQKEHARLVEQHAAAATRMQQQLRDDPERLRRQTNIDTLTRQLDELKYDADKHKADQQCAEAIKQQLQNYEQMQHLQHTQRERMSTVQAIIAELKELRTKLQDLATAAAAHKALQEAAHQLATQQQHGKQRMQEFAARKEALLEQKGRIEQQLAMFVIMQSERAQHEQKIDELRQQVEDYQAIAQAFGKNGIQALLIEDAIPEIEQAANDLLGRLTDNQSHIMIESLRDLKSGGTKETLDIKISDSAGIRPYEMFSGGEAFRIDFALRIAISKLLARRAGTSLQTLIIDEGFGSQDEEGIAHIMEAIYRIQDDFKKILIVSHLPTMKDQFPVHFMVHKGPNGSNVQVIEQA